MTQADQPENLWIAAYRKGDVTALGRLVEFYRKPLYAFIYNMLQGRGDAEDIFQEVWLRAIKNFDRYREKNFIGWLFRIAHNLIIDRLRREKKLPTANFADESNTSSTSPIDTFATRDPSPDRNSANADLGHRITIALQELSEEQREVFLLRTEANVPFKEIAEMQGTSLNTALSRMNYALQKLRPILQEDYQLLVGETRHETRT